MWTVFHTCAMCYAQDCHCASKTQGPEAELSCLAPGSGKRGVPGSLWELQDTHTEPLSLFILARLLKELLHWTKAEAFFCFSLSSLLASGLQENVFLNLKVFQNKFCKWELLVSVPSTSASFLPQRKNNSELQSQHQLGPASWKRSRDIDGSPLLCPSSQFQPLTKFLVPDTAQVPTLTQFHLPLWMELLPLRETSCWTAWSKWIKGHLTVSGLFWFLFVLSLCPVGSLGEEESAL